MNGNIPQDDSQKELDSNILIDLQKIKVSKWQSSKYGIYESQMQQFMQQYPEPSQNCDIEHSNLRTIFTYIFQKKTQSFIYRSSDCCLQVCVLNNTKSKDYILIEIRYNNRVIKNVSIFIKAEGSPFHENCAFSRGNFANVYKAKIQGKFIAIKCFKTSEEKSIFSQFVKVVKQFALLSMAEQLGAGPSTSQIKGFSIMIYRNCIEFTMQNCQQVSGYTPQIEKDLKNALIKLHRYQIVHFDIKPQNICFSPSLNKYIFIDFGLSEYITEKLGQAKVLSFRGTIGYCSDEMRICQNLSYGVVDPYYNDLYCLNESLKILKQFDLELNDKVNYFHIIDSNFKNIQLYRYLLSLDYNKILRKNIYLHINQIKSFQQCEQFVSIVQKFELSYQISLAYNYLLVKQHQICKSKTSNSYALNGIEIASIENNNNCLLQQIIGIYNDIFQSEQQSNQEADSDNFRILTDIESFNQNKNQKIIYIQNFVEYRGISTIQLTTEQILLEYYKILFKKISYQQDSLEKMMLFAHFLPSFLLFELIKREQLLRNFNKCLCQFYRGRKQAERQGLWILVILKFMISIQWVQYSFDSAYRHDQLQHSMFQELNKMVQRMPQGYFGSQRVSNNHIILGLIHKFSKLSTINEYILLIIQIETLCFERDIDNELYEFIQYLYCLILSRASFSNLYRDFFDRKLNSLILENRKLANYKLYPYYLNVHKCIYRLSQNHAKWVMQSVKMTFSDFSFFQKTYLYYYDKQKIFNFPALSNQIEQITKKIFQHYQKHIYLHRIIKLFLYNKCEVFAAKEKQLNSFVNKIGDKQAIISLMCQKHFHRSHNDYISEITVLFRYFIAGIISQNVIEVQNYQNYDLQSKKLGINKVGEKISQFINIQINNRVIQRQKYLVLIEQFIGIWQILQTPKCLICKIRHSVYLQLLKSLRLHLLGDIDNSFQLFTVLMINSHREKDLQQFQNDAFSIYFYFYYLKSVNTQNYNLPIFINLAIQTSYKNQFHLLHIILNSYQLYYQLFKQTLILYPLTAFYQLILPTTLNLRINNNFDLCQKMQIFFITSWLRLKKQVPPQIFQSIWQDHIYIELMTFINFAMKEKQSFFFYSISYILSIMRMFQLPFESCLNLYKFISIALEYQPRNLRYFYIGKFYQVYYRNVENLRFYRFKSKMVWKLKSIYDKQDQNNITSIVKARWKRGKTEKKLYQIIYKKIVKYTKGSRYN